MPKKKIDKDLVIKLARLNCTNDEIAFVCEVDTGTLERRYASLIRKEKAMGKTSLRRWQWAAAEKGNPAMLIWLGKQWLGQTDRIEQEIKTPEPTVIKMFSSNTEIVLGTRDVKAVERKEEPIKLIEPVGGGGEIEVDVAKKVVIDESDS